MFNNGIEIISLIKGANQLRIAMSVPSQKRFETIEGKNTVASASRLLIQSAALRGRRMSQGNAVRRGATS
jgi:hypothetical protein